METIVSHKIYEKFQIKLDFFKLNLTFFKTKFDLFKLNHFLKFTLTFLN